MTLTSRPPRRAGPTEGPRLQAGDGRRARPALSVTMIGTLPPWRAAAPYTKHLVEALETVDGVELEFYDFAALYPPFLYPGGEPMDKGAKRPRFRRVAVRRMLAWYNPFTWLRAGFGLRGRVVHAQWWSYVLAPVYLAVLGLARLRGRKVVLTLHNIEPHEGGRWRRALCRSVLRLGDAYIVHTEANAAALATAEPKAAGRTYVVPHGLIEVAGGGQLTQGEARRGLGLPQSGRVVLAFGNIRPYKGLDVLLRALRLVVDAGHEVTLVVAGQPWGSFEPYEQLIKQLGLRGHVRTWLEFLPDEQLAPFFVAADVAVYPYTHFDAQSGAATAALSLGVPIVVSDVGGLPELAGDARAVVRPNDPQALAESLITVLSDDLLRERLAADARERARGLDWDAIALRTAEVYRAVIEGAQAR